MKLKRALRTSAVIIALTLSFGALYVLSAGPFAVIERKYNLNTKGTWLWTFGEPLRRLYESETPAGAAYRTYYHLWVPKPEPMRLF